MKPTASWQARWKQMNSITPLARRAKPSRVAKNTWVADPGVDARSVSPARGHYDKDRPAIIAWVSRQDAVVLHATRDFTVKTVQKAANIAVQAGSRLYTDSASSYRALKGYVHEFVNHTQKEYARGEVHENRAECLFSLLKPYLRVFRGLSKVNLPGYLGFFQFLRNFHQQNACEQAELILRAALDPAIAHRAKRGEFVKCLDHFDLLQIARN
jgi:transposase-like protein